MKKINWRPYKPYLSATLDLGFMAFNTELMHQAVERYSYDYIMIRWRFFKWSGRFNLYNPNKDTPNE